MNIPTAKLFADAKLPTTLAVDQMVMISYVERKKDLVVYTGCIEKVWKYPQHYEVKVAFLPNNDIAYETLYLQDFNNWDSPNAWSIMRSPLEAPKNDWMFIGWLGFYIILIGIVIAAVLMHADVIDYVRFEVI
jgi:hypothetical protein